MSSREYRKATSFIDFADQTYRLTSRFKSDLALIIGHAQSLAPSDTMNVRTVTGVTPMTLAELYQLQSAIAAQESAALASEV